MRPLRRLESDPPEKGETEEVTRVGDCSGLAAELRREIMREAAATMPDFDAALEELAPEESCKRLVQPRDDSRDDPALSIDASAVREKQLPLPVAAATAGPQKTPLVLATVQVAVLFFLGAGFVFMLTR